MLYRGIAQDQYSTGEIFHFDSPDDRSAKWASAFLFAEFLIENKRKILHFWLRKINKPGKHWMDPKEKYEEILSCKKER